MADETLVASAVLNVAVAAGAALLLWHLEPRVRGTYLRLPMAIPFVALVAANLIEAMAALTAFSGDFEGAGRIARSRSVCVLIGEAALVNMFVLYPRRWPRRRALAAALPANGAAAAIAALGPSGLIFGQPAASGAYPAPVYLHGFWVAQGTLLVVIVLCVVATFFVYRKPRSSTEKRAALGMLVSVAVPLTLYAGLLAAGVAVQNGQVVTVVLSLFLVGMALAVRTGHLPLPIPSNVERVLGTSTTPVVIVDREGLVAYANPFAHRYLGVRDGAVGDPFEPLLRAAVPDPGDASRLAAKVADVTGARERAYEMTAERVGPLQRAYRVIANPLVGADETVPIGCVVQFVDETDLREAQRASQRAQALQDLVIRVMGHDLKAPIMVIAGYLQLADASLVAPLDEAQRASLRGSLQKAGQAASLMNVIMANARAISRVTMGADAAVTPEKADLSKLVADVVEVLKPLADAKKVTVRVEGPQHLPITLVPGFESVVTNLLSNAIKFTPHGGAVGVRWEADESHAGIEVWDSGPGVPPEMRDKIFRKFERLGSESEKVEGHGLGLSIAAQIVALCGGTISIGDKDDGTSGASFIVELPREQPKPAAAEPTSPR